MRSQRSVNRFATRRPLSTGSSVRRPDRMPKLRIIVHPVERDDADQEECNPCVETQHYGHRTRLGRRIVPSWVVRVRGCGAIRRRIRKRIVSARSSHLIMSSWKMNTFLQHLPTLDKSKHAERERQLGMGYLRQFKLEEARSVRCASLSPRPPLSALDLTPFLSFRRDQHFEKCLDLADQCKNTPMKTRAMSGLAQVRGVTSKLS